MMFSKLFIQELINPCRLVFSSYTIGFVDSLPPMVFEKYIFALWQAAGIYASFWTGW
jgi:hypothetical protein